MISDMYIEQSLKSLIVEIRIFEGTNVHSIDFDM
jgi:hypothetical protein